MGGAGSGTQCPGPLKQTLPHSGIAAQLTARKRRQRSQVCRDTGCGHLAGCSLSRSCKDGSGHHTLAFSGQAPGAGVPPHGPTWLQWPPQRAVLIQPGVGVVFCSGSTKTLGHQPTVGTRDGWPSLLVGRHGQRAGAADTGGCRVLGTSAHEAGLAALAVVTLGVVLAALGQREQFSTHSGGLAPTSSIPSSAGPVPRAPTPAHTSAFPQPRTQRCPGLPYPVSLVPASHPSQGPTYHTDA